MKPLIIKTKKQKALEFLKDSRFSITIAEACRLAELADTAGVRKHIYKHGGQKAWISKGYPI